MKYNHYFYLSGEDPRFFSHPALLQRFGNHVQCIRISNPPKMPAGIKNSVIIDPGRHVLCFLFQLRHRISHGDGYPLRHEHGQVVVIIAEYDDILRGCAEMIQHTINPFGLVHRFYEKVSRNVTNRRKVFQCLKLTLLLGGTGYEQFVELRILCPVMGIESRYNNGPHVPVPALPLKSAVPCQTVHAVLRSKGPRETFSLALVEECQAFLIIQRLDSQHLTVIVTPFPPSWTMFLKPRSVIYFFAIQ